MPVKGKQLIDNTITQPKLNLSNPVLPYDAATKQYVDENASVEFNSISNKAMTALLTTDDNDLATNTILIDQPVAGSGVDVTINGISIPSGNSITDACYFSPDGIYKRAKGNERLNDTLYWVGSVSDFELDVTDYIDFAYIISFSDNRIIILENSDVYDYNPLRNQNIFSYNGVNSTSATVIIDGAAFDVGNVSGNFIFDIGDVNGYETTFTTIGETIQITVNSSTYDIVYDGVEMFLDFTINKI